MARLALSRFQSAASCELLRNLKTLNFVPHVGNLAQRNDISLILVFKELGIENNFFPTITADLFSYIEE